MTIKEALAALAVAMGGDVSGTESKADLVAIIAEQVASQSSPADDVLNDGELPLPQPPSNV